MNTFNLKSAWLFLIALTVAGFETTCVAQQDAPLTVAGIFGDGMVLQQESSAAIWGRANPNAKIEIKASWIDAVISTSANENGQWKTAIDTPKAGGPFTLTVSSGSQKKDFKNILSGEVWICSGQSNMQWKMRGFGHDHWKEELQKADHPNIRLCQVPQALSLKPQDDVQTTWTECTPNSALSFSAVAYFFGNRLHEELEVPIGLISTSWGGSSAEAWVNPDVLENEFPEFAKVMKGYDGLVEKHGATHANNKNKPKGLNQRMPAVLYNKMIRPVVPFSFRGVIWYQGESNVKHPYQYRKLFPTLIENWRQEWGQGDFPFYFVQIAPFKYQREPLPVALLREAQLQTLSVANTGMVVTMDIGNANNIHPKKKKPVGERLARLALAKDYGHADLIYSGPEYVSHEVDGDQIRLQFKHLGGGLATRDGKPPSHFTMAGEDQVFHPAEAVVDGDSVLVRSPKVSNPAAVRFAWGNADAPNLMNKEGLPCSSFRTDDWEIQPSTAKPKPDSGKRKISHSFIGVGRKTGIVIVGEDGKVKWRVKLPASDAWVQENGNVLAALYPTKDFPAGGVAEIDRKTKEIRWSYQGQQKEISTVEQIGDDEYLVAELGSKPRAIVINRAGEILRETAFQCQTGESNREVHMQTRMLRMLPNGNYLTPHLLDFAVKEYDVKSGEVVRSIPTDDRGREKRDWPFSAIRLDNGNTLISCTNGNRVIEVDAKNKIVWSVDNKDLGEPIIRDACGAQRLASGNTVIASYGSKNDQVKLLEVTPGKKVVWRFNGLQSGLHHFQILTTNGEKVTSKMK